MTDDVDELQETLHDLHGYALAIVQSEVEQGNGIEAAKAYGRVWAYRQMLSVVDEWKETGEFPERESAPGLAEFSKAKIALDEANSEQQEEPNLRGMQ